MFYERILIDFKISIIFFSGCRFMWHFLLSNVDLWWLCLFMKFTFAVFMLNQQMKNPIQSIDQSWIDREKPRNVINHLNYIILLCVSVHFYYVKSNKMFTAASHSTKQNIIDPLSYNIIKIAFNMHIVHDTIIVSMFIFSFCLSFSFTFDDFYFLLDYIFMASLFLIFVLCYCTQCIYIYMHSCMMSLALRAKWCFHEK